MHACIKAVTLLIIVIGAAGSFFGLVFPPPTQKKVSDGRVTFGASRRRSYDTSQSQGNIMKVPVPAPSRSSGPFYFIAEDWPPLPRIYDS